MQLRCVASRYPVPTSVRSAPLLHQPAAIVRCIWPCASLRAARCRASVPLCLESTTGLHRGANLPATARRALSHTKLRAPVAPASSPRSHLRGQAPRPRRPHDASVQHSLVVCLWALTLDVVAPAALYSSSRLFQPAGTRRNEGNPQSSSCAYEKPLCVTPAPTFPRRCFLRFGCTAAAGDARLGSIHLRSRSLRGGSLLVHYRFCPPCLPSRRSIRR
jgi:hypothetical protein